MSISLNNFVNLNDGQLYQMAEYQTALDADKKKLTNNSILYGIPLMDSFARATMQEGGVGIKTATFANRMCGWIGFLALASVYNTAFDSVKKHCPAVKKFEENHPIASTAMSVLGLWVIADYAHKGLKKLTDIASQKYPEPFIKMGFGKQNIIDKLDKSWVDKKVYKPISNSIKYMEKNFPEITVGLKNVLPWVVPVVVATAFTKSLCIVNDMRAKTQENYQRLKNIQDFVKQQID